MESNVYRKGLIGKCAGASEEEGSSQQAAVRFSSLQSERVSVGGLS